MGRKAGKWEPIIFGITIYKRKRCAYYSLSGFKCSLCGYEHRYPQFYIFEFRKNYCPNCGAKMSVKELNAEHYNIVGKEKWLRIYSNTEIDGNCCDVYMALKKFGSEFYSKKVKGLDLRGDQHGKDEQHRSDAGL